MLGHGAEIGPGVIAKNETDTRMGIPAIQMLGLGKIVIATQQHLAEAGAETAGSGPVQCRGGAFVGRTITRPIDDPQHLAGVGQAHDQRMITPGAIVGDVDALFAFTVRAHQGAIGIQDGLLEEAIGLLFPNVSANLVIDVLQQVDLEDVEAATKITRGRRVGNALGAQGVEEVDIVATQFDVLQTITIAERVESDIEHMIGFVIALVNLENMQSAVDGVDQTNPPCQKVQGPDAAVSDAMHTIGHFVVDIAGGEHGLGGVAGLGFVEPPLDLALASVQPIPYSTFHSKPPFYSRRLEAVHLSDAEKNQEFRVFFTNPVPHTEPGSLDQGLRMPGVIMASTAFAGLRLLEVGDHF